MPSIRFDQILELLRDKKTLTPKEIKERYGVSLMTAYRDIDDLVQAGYVRKVRGAIRLAQTVYSGPETCSYCGGTVSQRNSFTLQMADQKKLSTCCPHCGFALLARTPETVSALATDFLHGTIVNVRQATFLLDSQFIYCCAPSVLAFASDTEAKKFQTGFGGRLVEFNEAFQSVLESMALPTTKQQA